MTHRPSNHWMTQRITAVLFFALTGWFLCAAPYLIHIDASGAREWFMQPYHAALSMAFIIVAVVHHYFHLEEVVEDYVHNKGVKSATFFILRTLALSLMTAGVYAIVHINMGY